MTNPAVPVDGPYRITVEPIPTGVTLDIEPYVQHVVHDVVAALLSNDTYADRFAELQDAEASDPYVIQRAGDLRFEGLVADLVAVVGSKLPVYGRQALRLADRVEQLATPTISSLRATEGGAAA